MKASDRYAMYVGEARSTISIASLVDGANVARTAARERPGVKHTVTIDGLVYAHYTLLPSGAMRRWVR